MSGGLATPTPREYSYGLPHKSTVAKSLKTSFSSQWHIGLACLLQGYGPCRPAFESACWMFLQYLTDSLAIEARCRVIATVRQGICGFPQPLRVYGLCVWCWVEIKRRNVLYCANCCAPLPRCPFNATVSSQPLGFS